MRAVLGRWARDVWDRRSGAPVGPPGLGRGARWMAVLLGVVLLPAQPCAQPACSCIRSPSPQIAREAADAVFLGRVIAAREATLPGDVEIPARSIVLRVEAAWKGVAADKDTVVVTTGWGGGDCGYPFVVDGRYLVYAHRGTGGLSTGICSRTAPVAAADADLNALGAPSVRRSK